MPSVTKADLDLICWDMQQYFDRQNILERDENHLKWPRSINTPCSDQ